MSNKHLSEQQIAIHSLADNLCDLGIAELDKGISFGPGSLFGAGSLDAQDIAILAKVGLELFFHKSVGQVSDIDDSFLR
jgi:hypothetical protein